MNIKSIHTEEKPVSLKLKLATMWASLMFLYIYVDYFHLFIPGKIEDIQTGRVFEFGITQGFLLAALASMTIPALMIFLSVSVPAKVNRWANIIIAAVYIPFTLFNLAGEAWMHIITTGEGTWRFNDKNGNLQIDQGES